MTSRCSARTFGCLATLSAAIACFIITAPIGIAPAQDFKPKPFTKRSKEDAKRNKTIGFIWEYRGFEVVDDKPTGAKIDGRLRVFNYEAFEGPKKVGTVKPNGPLESTLTITDLPALNGSVTLKKIGNQPPLWAGLLVKDDGSKWKLVVRFLQN